jgi:hypothetical protein
MSIRWIQLYILMLVILYVEFLAKMVVMAMPPIGRGDA